MASSTLQKCHHEKEKLSQIRSTYLNMINALWDPELNPEPEREKGHLLDNCRNLNNICRLVNRVIVMLISYL